MPSFFKLYPKTKASYYRSSQPEVRFTEQLEQDVNRVVTSSGTLPQVRIFWKN